MIVFADYKKNFYDNETTWGVYDDQTGIYEEYMPEDIPVLLADIVLSAKETTEIFFQHLDNYYMDVINSLFFSGCTPVSGNPSIKEMRAKQMKYLISDSGACYHITIKIRKKKVQILNATSITTVKDRKGIIETFGDGNDTAKGYTIGTYYALLALLDGTTQKSRPLTMGAAAKRDWQNMIGFWESKSLLKDCNKQNYNKKQTFENFLRPAYHGGLCLYDEDKTATEVGKGYAIDCNSLYPFVMATCALPYGQGHVFSGEPDEKLKRDTSNGFVGFFVKFRARFKLKKDGVPCVRVDNTNQLLYHELGWLTSSDFYNSSKMEFYENAKGVWLTLCNIDFQTFKDNYDFEILEWEGGIWFPLTKFMFCDYVKKWYGIKEKAGTAAIRKISKFFLNTLSGKMACWPEMYNMEIKPKNGKLTQERKKSKSKPASYVHVGAFITAWGRRILINAIKANKGRWIYSDTDSLHLLGTEKPNGVVIGTGLGEWKIEKEFDKAYYYERKQYGMIKDGIPNFTLAGRTSYAVDYIEEAYKAGGDYIKFKYAERMTELQANALYRTYKGNDDDGDKEIMGEMEKKRRGEELVEEFAKSDGLRAPLFCKAEEWMKIAGEPFNIKFEKAYISLKE